MKLLLRGAISVFVAFAPRGDLPIGGRVEDYVWFPDHAPGVVSEVVPGLKQAEVYLGPWFRGIVAKSRHF